MAPQEQNSVSINTIEPSPPQKKYPLTAVILVALLLVSLISYAAYVRFLKPSSKSTPTTKTPSSNELVFAPQPALEGEEANTDSKTRFTCPTRPNLCKNAQIYKKNEIQTKVASGSALIASFDGELEILESSSQVGQDTKKFSTLILKDSKEGLLAYYNFNGAVSAKPGLVKEGAVLANSNNQLLPKYDNASFVFRMVRLGKKGNDLIDIKPEIFK